MELSGDTAYCYNILQDYRKKLETYKKLTNDIAINNKLKEGLLQKLEDTRYVSQELLDKGYVEVNGELRNCNVDLKCAKSNGIDSATNYGCFDVESPYSGDTFMKKCKVIHNVGCCTIKKGDSVAEFSKNGKLNTSIFYDEIKPKIDALDVANKSNWKEINDMNIFPECNPKGDKYPTDITSESFYDDGVNFYNAAISSVELIPVNLTGVSPADFDTKVMTINPKGFNPIDNTIYGITVELWIILLFVIISLIYLTYTNLTMEKNHIKSI